MNGDNFNNYENIQTKDSFSGIGNYSYTSTTGLLKQIEVSNDDYSTDLTYTVDGKTFVVKPDEISIENLVSFSTVVITAIGAWRAIVRA